MSGRRRHDNRDRRGNRDSPLTTYLIAGAAVGFLCAGLFGLWLYDSSNALFGGGGIGALVDGLLFPLLARRPD